MNVKFISYKAAWLQKLTWSNENKWSNFLVAKQLDTSCISGKLAYLNYYANAKKIRVKFHNISINIDTLTLTLGNEGVATGGMRKHNKAQQSANVTSRQEACKKVTG